MNPPRLILASGSAIRAAILRNAGVAFTAEKPAVDEAAVKRAMEGEDLEKVAMALAEAKALAVRAPGLPSPKRSRPHCELSKDGFAQAGDFVLGSDQILEFEGRAFDKAGTMAEARARLLELQGRSHTLINAAAIAQDGAIVFRHFARPRLFMRALTAGEIDAYLNKAGEEVLQSVGAYQIEGLGAQLFERIEGDYFAVLGLALFPVLGFLRAQGMGPF